MFHISVYFAWIGIYLGNGALNVVLWFQLDVNNDLRPFLVWFAYTIIVFIVRLVSMPQYSVISLMVISVYLIWNCIIQLT